MGKLHYTLNPSTNTLLILLWGIFAGVFTYISRPYSLLMITLGAILGLIGGYMQRLALAEAKLNFIDASSMMEIRKILMETKWGKIYIYLLWSGFIIMIISPIALGLPKAPFLIISGYFTQMFSREIVTLKSTKELSRMVKL